MHAILKGRIRIHIFKKIRERISLKSIPQYIYFHVPYDVSESPSWWPGNHTDHMDI